MLEKTADVQFQNKSYARQWIGEILVASPKNSLGCVKRVAGAV
jgi:hypothetical protein